MIFLHNKYTRIYFQLIEKRKKEILFKKDVYCEAHHIIPKSLGGTNDKKNLVNLSPREHFIAHLLLTKMVQTENALIKMNWALHKMCYSNTCDYFTGKDYQWYRERHITFLKEYHPSKQDSWRKAISEKVLLDWQNNADRRNKMKETMKKWREENREQFVDNCRKNAKLGGQAAKDKIAKRLEYKGKIYIGWNHLYEETGISKFLYKKYYLKGFDPSDRINSDGPVPRNYIPKPIE
jgi:hypothetical protein